jgi:hypothetical protein
MDQLLMLLRRLSEHHVEFVLIGGYAAMTYGSPVVTQDVDVCAPLNLPNLTRIVEALRGLDPRFRFHPDRPHLYEDPARLIGFRNLNLVTDCGVLDILGELPGVGTFDDLAGRYNRIDFGGFTCNVLELDALISSKRFAGREKDVANIRHLEAIQRLKREQPGLFDAPPGASAAGPDSTQTDE